MVKAAVNLITKGQEFFQNINSGGQIESFKNGGGQNLNHVEFSRAANEVQLSIDV